MNASASEGPRLPALAGLRRRLLQLRFRGSRDYWEERYRLGGTSGEGSYGESARYKASVINDFVEEHGIASVIEFGCGDGHQLSLAEYPSYIGLDVSPAAIETCIARFGNDTSKSFFLYSGAHYVDHHRLFRAELGLSLDVIYHLVEDAVLAAYLSHLFGAASRYVLIYSSNEARHDLARHVRHRNFSHLIAENMPTWSLVASLENPLTDAPAKFFIYERHSEAIVAR